MHGRKLCNPRSFVYTGAGHDVVEDRINENTAYTPAPVAGQIDDVFVGAEKDGYLDPYQSLLKAYASNFVNVDTLHYSAAVEPTRLPSGWAGNDNAPLCERLAA